MPPDNSSADDQVYNEFKTDRHRRVVANLAAPRSSADLASFLARNDPYVRPRHKDEPDVRTVEGAEVVLEELEAEGLVKKIPAPQTAQALIDAVKSDDDVPDLHRDRHKHLKQRADRHDAYPYLEDEDQWYMTNAALARLKGPVFDEPLPLEGDALRAAQEQQERVREDDARIIREELERDRDLRQKALEEAEKRLKDLE
jgi:hypothetical protein